MTVTPRSRREGALAATPLSRKGKETPSLGYMTSFTAPRTTPRVQRYHASQATPTTMASAAHGCPAMNWAQLVCPQTQLLP